MTLQVEIGQKTDNGLTQVTAYQLPNGSKYKYGMKSYAVKNEQADEFVKEYKNKSAASSKLIMPFSFLGAALGTFFGWRHPKNTNFKPIVALTGLIGGAVFGCAPAAIYEGISLRNTIKKYNAQRIATPQENK